MNLLEEIDGNNVFANLEFVIRGWEFHRIPNLLLADECWVFFFSWLAVFLVVCVWFSFPHETEKDSFHSGHIYVEVYFNSIKSTTVPKCRKADWNLTAGLKIS